MKHYIVSSLAESVGIIWRNLQEKYTKQRTFYVSSPLSSTPLPIYDWIIKNADTFTNWGKMKFVLMDEMLEGDKKHLSYVPKTDSASYEGFALKYLFKPLANAIKLDTQITKPELDSIQSFETPLDLLILALGVKGNYANVMPGTTVEKSWHITHLIPEFREAHTQKGSDSFEGVTGTH